MTMFLILLNMGVGILVGFGFGIEYRDRQEFMRRLRMDHQKFVRKLEALRG